jgi:molecular chaperone DnaK
MPPRDLPMLARIREAAEAGQNPPFHRRNRRKSRCPSSTPDFHFQLHAASRRIGGLDRDILLRTRPHCLRSLADAKLEAKDLDQVILVGGQTRMPLVRQMAAEIFGCAEFDETRGGLRLGRIITSRPARG